VASGDGGGDTSSGKKLHQERSHATTEEEGVAPPPGKAGEGVSAEKTIGEEEETIMEERGHAFPLMCDGLCVMGVLFQEGTVEA
jgi:hypothetical protein